MSRRILAVLLCVSLLGLPGFAADRDASRNDVRGIPHGHKHLWAVIGGTALGLGLGAIPGGTSNVLKGGLIGGSAASLFYLAGHRSQGGQEGPWSYVITNAALVAGIGWAACDCGAGFGAGALVGGGGTALFQSFKPRNRTLGKVTGANAPGAPDTSAQAPPPQQHYPPAQNPSALPQSDNPQVQPQATPPQSAPPAQPQTAPPAQTVPPTEPQTAPQAPPQTVPPAEPQPTPQTPPPQGQQSNPPHATLLPDAPEPKGH